MPVERPGERAPELGTKVQRDYRTLLSIPSAFLLAQGIGYLFRGKLDSAQPVLPMNPWFNYYGFPWNMILFGLFFTASIQKHGRKGFYLSILTYCSWELVSIAWSNPLEPLFLLMLAYSAFVVTRGGFFRPSWKGLSLLLAYRILTSSYAQQLPYFGPGSSCGLTLCAGTDPVIFALEQVIYTLMVFLWVNEGLRDPLIPRLREDLARVLEKARGARLP